ncbi:MAG: hypothetical protein NTX53_04445 [candidate division WOR-3 bacterium]|nr:hypothetical protein [candidate division WOR-3 bacterium]
MSTPAPDAVKRPIDARDVTEMSDISDRVPSLADRNVFLSGGYKEEQLRLTAGHQARVEKEPEVRKATACAPVLDLAIRSGYVDSENAR